MTELTMDELKTAFRLVIRFFLKGEQVPVVLVFSIKIISGKTKSNNKNKF